MAKIITTRQTDDQPLQSNYVVQDEELPKDKAKREAYEKELDDSQAEIDRIVKDAVSAGEAYDEDEINRLQVEKEERREKYKKYYDWRA